MRASVHTHALTWTRCSHPLPSGGPVNLVLNGACFIHHLAMVATGFDPPFGDGGLTLEILRVLLNEVGFVLPLVYLDNHLVGFAPESIDLDRFFEAPRCFVQLTSARIT